MSDAESKKPILLVVHSEWSRPGQIEAALNAKGWPTERCCISAGDSLPEPFDNHGGAVIFGGPMSANDEHLDFIRAELDWIPKVVEAGTPFFGVCLGGQILARCLGGSVARHPDGLYEVGYYPVSPTPQSDGIFDDLEHVFHWHGEGFTVPDCAELLVTGESFPNQAFRCNSTTYSIQFHPEMQEDTLELWSDQAWDKHDWPGGHHPKVHREQHARYGGAMHHWLDRFIDVWLGEPA